METLVERKTGLEPATLTLARLCSTNWATSAYECQCFRVFPFPFCTAKIWWLFELTKHFEEFLGSLSVSRCLLGMKNLVFGAGRCVLDGVIGGCRWKGCPREDEWKANLSSGEGRAFWWRTSTFLWLNVDVPRTGRVTWSRVEWKSGLGLLILERR